MEKLNIQLLMKVEMVLYVLRWGREQSMVTMMWSEDENSEVMMEGRSRWEPMRIQRVCADGVAVCGCSSCRMGKKREAEMRRVKR